MAGDEELTPRRFAPRRRLKKIGIGAGIAWSAPVVLSFYNAAGAATGTPDNSSTTTAETVPTRPECAGATCGTFRECSAPGNKCVCVTTGDPSVAYCVPAAIHCDTLQTCAPDFTCPPGFFCAVDTCCFFTGTTESRPVCTPIVLTQGCPPVEPTGPVEPRSRS